MKNATSLLFAFLTLIACNKKNDNTCTPVTPESEAGQIAAFCASNGITSTVDTNGIYYQIIDPGSGVTPNMSSVVTVTYTSYMLDGSLVEDKSTSPVTTPLSDFIEGWRIALPYIQKGGHIKMVIPSSLAYGCTGIPGLIPPNTPLYYDVVLANVE